MELVLEVKLLLALRLVLQPLQVRKPVEHSPLVELGWYECGSRFRDFVCSRYSTIIFFFVI